MSRAARAGGSAPAIHAGFAIDGLAFARDGARLSGRIEGGQLERLAELQCKVPGGLEFSLAGGVNEFGKPALELHVAGDVELVCQRCLGPLPYRLQADVQLELAASAAQVESADDEVDRVVASRSMSVAGLVEDEAILGLPMIPRHEGCAEVDGVVADPAEQPVRPSPFAVLKTLKGH